MIILASPFNLGGPDGLIIFILILLLFGAKRLPELARGLGSAVREFSKAKDEIEHEITRRDPPPRIESPRDTEPHLTSSSDTVHHDDPYHQETYPDHPAPEKEHLVAQTDHSAPAPTAAENQPPKSDAGARTVAGPATDGPHIPV